MKILTWGRKHSRQVQELSSKVGGGAENSLQLQCYEMVHYRKEGTTLCIGIWLF